MYKNDNHIQTNKFEISFQVTDKILKQAINLDKQVFCKKEVGDFKTCKTITKINNDIYTFLLYEGKCVGYINFCRISENAFCQFYAGKMKDYSLHINDFLPFKKNESNKCLLMSIVIAKEFRDTIAIKILSDGFYKHLDKLRNEGIIIDEVIIDCISIDGVKYVIENMGAKYICDSHNGKIYHTFNIYSKLNSPKIQLEVLNKSNLKIASLIQYEIFKKNWCGYCDLLSEANNRHDKEINDLPLTFLIKYHNKYVGIIGLYELKNYPKTIWLNWFGIMPKYRNRGIGTHALFKLIKVARQFKRKEFRLVTYKIWNCQAQHIYQKTMQKSELYTNKNDWQYAIKNGIAMVFSSNLFDKTVTNWNNKFIDLISDKKLHNDSIKKLIEDGLITESEYLIK